MSTTRIPTTWANGAGQDITNAFKGVGELLARFAEPVMRYATIYLALSTALPVLNWGPLYNICMLIVIASPEFVLVGALAIAEQACKNGQKGWGRLLYLVCLILASIMIATFVDIFIVAFYPWAIACLNFSRCVTAVGFSIILNKLESSRATQTVADFDQEIEALREELTQELTTVKDQIAAIQPFDPAPLMRQIQSQISAIKVPDPEQFKSQIDDQMTTMFDQFGASFSEQTMTEVSALIANHFHPIDYNQLALEVASLLSPNADDTPKEEPENDQDNSQKSARITAKLVDPTTDDLASKPTNRRATKAVTPAQKMERALQKNPGLSAAELVSKYGGSLTTARRVKRSQNVSTVTA